MSWLLALILGKLGLFTIGGLLIVGTVAAFMAGLRNLGLALIATIIIYFGTSLIWHDGVGYGSATEAAKWTAVVAKAKAEQQAAVDRSVILAQNLTLARQDFASRLADKRAAIDADMIKEHEDEEAAVQKATPGARKCTCADSQRDVDRLYDILRSKRKH